MKLVMRLMLAMALALSGAACATDQPRGDKPVEGFDTAPSVAGGNASPSPTPAPQPTEDAEATTSLSRVELPVTGPDCTGTLAFQVDKDWSFDDADSSREMLFYRLPPDGAELPSASLSAECRRQSSLDADQASQFKWGDLQGYVDFAIPSISPDAAVTATTLAGLPALAVTTSQNGAYVHIVCAFTKGNDPLLVSIFVVELSDTLNEDILQSEVDRVLKTASVIELTPS